MQLLKIFSIFLFSIHTIFPSQKLNPENYEEALKRSPYCSIHQSDCLITAYDVHNNNQYAYATGTYMKDPQSDKTFILTTAHLLNNPLSKVPMTVTFDGIQEYPLKGYTPFFSELYTSNDDNLKKNIQFHFALDIGIGFIPTYDGDIQPAEFPPFEIQENTDKNTSEYAVMWGQAIRTPEAEYSISGYGTLISPKSTEDALIFKKNSLRKKTLVTLKASPDLRTGTVTGAGIRFTAIYQKPGTLDATPFEQPLRHGFSGASVRSKEGYVVGVVSSSASNFITESFIMQHPYISKMIIFTQKIIEYYDNPIYYFSSVFVPGMIASYAIENNYLGSLGFSTTLVGSCVAACIPSLSSILKNNIRFPGTRSSFCSTLMWQSKISNIVGDYYKEKNEKLSS